MKVVIFDFDGTMFHTAPEIHLAINETLKEYQHSTLSYAEVTNCIGHGLLHLIKSLNLDLDTSPEGLKKIGASFRKHYENFFHQSKPYPGLKEFLISNPLPKAVASNKDESYIKKVLSKEDWSFFTWIAINGGNTFKTQKPEPEIITDILEKVGAKPHEAVIVGDGHPDIQVAKRTGIYSIAVSYGYSPIDELIELGADKVIHNLFELEEAIRDLS
jgi:phosphoglycolate phosphatase